MTSNQINYARLHEDVRHNLASEALSRVGNEIAFAKAYADQRNAETNAKNAETNLLNASLRRMELVETNRANVAREYETARSNMAAEQLRSMENYERARSNQANEALTYQRNVETTRANQASETLQTMQQSESVRHNERTEQQAQTNTRAGIVQTLINAAGNLIGRFAR